MPTAPATPATRPNILWISLEDTSPRFGCHGDPVARTPNLDRLAAGGCVYPNAFSVAGVSAPSRAAIITGMYPTFIGAHHMRTSHTDARSPSMPTPYETVPPPYVKCFPEYLRQAGYYCSNNSKTDYQFNPPFSAWDDCGANAHWRNRAQGQPFFAVFNPTVTHESGMWPKPDKPLKTDPEKVALPPYLPNTRKAREALARHYDNLETADACAGELLAQLEEDGLAQNTIVFLWSDHGEGLPRRKRWPYDSGTRIPLIVRWPGTLKPGSRNERLVSLIDLGPTVLALCGVPLPAHLQGRPFTGPQERPRDFVFATRDRHDTAYDMVRSARDARYRYVRHYFPGTPYLPWVPYRNRHPAAQELFRLHREGNLKGEQDWLFRTRPPEELFDTQADPHELQNLAADPAHAEALQRLRGALDEWRADFDRYGEVSEEEMVRRWYPGEQQPPTAPPLAFPLTGENCAQEVLDEKQAYAAPLMVQLHCSTQGASLGWQLDGETGWRPYTGPLRLTQSVTLRAKAVRIGYRESEISEWAIKISG